MKYIEVDQYKISSNLEINKIFWVTGKYYDDQ